MIEGRPKRAALFICGHRPVFASPFSKGGLRGINYFTSTQAECAG